MNDKIGYNQLLPMSSSGINMLYALFILDVVDYKIYAACIKELIKRRDSGT